MKSRKIKTKKMKKSQKYKKSKFFKSSKKFRQKGGNSWKFCAHKFDGVDFCRKCCSKYNNNYKDCLDLCMTPI